jgi:hypothetical protein
MILAHQQTGDIHGFVLQGNHDSVEFTIGDVVLHVSLDNSFDGEAKSGYGLIMATGNGEFLGAGKGFRVTFTPQPRTASHVGISYVDEGDFKDGKWIPGRRMNGDEDDQGVAWRFSPHGQTIEKVVLYRYE